MIPEFFLNIWKEYIVKNFSVVYLHNTEIYLLIYHLNLIMKWTVKLNPPKNQHFHIFSPSSVTFEMIPLSLRINRWYYTSNPAKIDISPGFLLEKIEEGVNSRG